MRTIFEDVVRSENAHTELLRNLMERDSAFAAAALSLFLNREVQPEEAESCDFRTQVKHVGAIPDLDVRSATST